MRTRRPKVCTVYARIGAHIAIVRACLTCVHVLLAAYHCLRAYPRRVHPLTRASPDCTRVTPFHVHTCRACLLLHTCTTIRASVFFLCACIIMHVSFPAWPSAPI